MANIFTDHTAKNGKTDIQIQGGLKTDMEIELAFLDFTRKRGFAVPDFVLSKLKQAYYQGNMQDRLGDVLVEDIGYWNEK